MVLNANLDKNKNKNKNLNSKKKVLMLEVSVWLFLLILLFSLLFIHPHREYPEPSAGHGPSPKTGDHKGVIFQSWPCPPPAEGVRLWFKGRWETSEALFPACNPSLSPASPGAAF